MGRDGLYLYISAATMKVEDQQLRNRKSARKHDSWRRKGGFLSEKGSLC